MIEGDDVGRGCGSGDGVGHGFVCVEVGRGEVVRGELGSDMDSDEVSVVGFFGGVVAIAGSDWFDGLCVCGPVDGLMVCVCVCVWLC